MRSLVVALVLALGAWAVVQAVTAEPVASPAAPCQCWSYRSTDKGV